MSLWSSNPTMAGVTKMWAICLFCLVYINARGSASPTHGSTQKPLEDRVPLIYAAFGDSWASGVNWGPPSEDTEYNFPDSDEVCRCRRMREAYPVQLLEDEDRSWSNGRPVELDFQACHGAWFDGIKDQVHRLRQDVTPDFATLMIGGNPAGFPEIIENCILQFNKDRNYGPEYPDEEGECAKTLRRSHDILDSYDFRIGLFQSINAIVTEPRIWRNPHFRLFVLGYAGLFNHDDTACDEFSFGIIPGKKPRLTTKLRRAINNVLDHGRQTYDFLINHVFFDPRVRFIDMNSVFAGHRFCEPTEQKTVEAQNDNSYLYAFSWPSCIPLTEDQRADDAYYTNHTSLSWPGFCRNCGGLGELGEFQRVFHPRTEGHNNYKDALKEILRK